VGVADLQWPLNHAAPEWRDEVNPFREQRASELKGHACVEDIPRLEVRVED
jgi:hypothetical protein